MECIVLDAMGVIFEAADDVTQLLIPFICDNNGETRAEIIEAAYMEASLGQISADEFWRRGKLDSSLEEQYLSRHSLTPGVFEFLQTAAGMKIPVWCLSNDIGRWSSKLRKSLGIESLLAGSVISSDVGIRKPDPGIYEHLLEQCRFRADQLLLIDDREKNVDAAIALGINAVRFRNFGEILGSIHQANTNKDKG